MKYNPITGKLFTDQGEFIKKLDCPLKKTWDEIHNGFCKSCKKLVIDTNDMTDKKVLKLLKKSPKTCIKINIDNLKIGNYETS